MIAVGRMRAKIKRKEILEVVPKKREIKKQRPRQSRTSASKTKKTVSIRTSANTVNVLGERTEAAEPLIEQAMSRAMSVGVLWIVHGHGTGRLKRGIREFLRDHDFVESFRDGDDSDGGTGVTVVELKSVF